MEVRQMSTAYLSHNEQFLMIKKSGSRLYNGEFWSGLGGHLEPSEINTPKEACVREIFEESGISRSDIHHLKLKYILIRIKEDEVRQQFVYFGEVPGKKPTLIPSEEGELEWMAPTELLHLHMSSINRFMITHYLENPDVSCVMVGTLTMGEDQTPHIQWAALKDPHQF
jgi:8-oxo-dGTP diphosphatase